MQVPGDKLAIIKDVVDMLHNASLLVDDIEDGSALRRGVPGMLRGSEWHAAAAHLLWPTQSRTTFTAFR